MRRGTCAAGLLAACLCLLAAVSPGRAASSPVAEAVPLEYQIKAAFLYKFVRFVEWPAPTFLETDGVLVIGVLGGGPMGRALEGIAGEEVGGHRLRVDLYETPEDLSYCHILFVHRADEEVLAGVLDAQYAVSTLTVGEQEGFAARGGIVNFVIVDNRVGFEINPGAAETADLKVSSKLLRLARIVGKAD